MVGILLTARECTELPSLSYVIIEMMDENRDGVTRISYGEMVRYECQPGFFRESGDQEKHCLDDGTLNGKDLVCKR